MLFAVVISEVNRFDIPLLPPPMKAKSRLFLPASAFPISRPLARRLRPSPAALPGEGIGAAARNVRAVFDQTAHKDENPIHPAQRLLAVSKRGRDCGAMLLEADFAGLLVVDFAVLRK
jgi:hypothetical protein